MAGQSRRKQAPIQFFFVNALGATLTATGAGQAVLWFQQPQWRGVRPPLALSIGMVLVGLPVLVVCLVWAFKRERARS